MYAGMMDQETSEWIIDYDSIIDAHLVHHRPAEFSGHAAEVG